VKKQGKSDLTGFTGFYKIKARQKQRFEPQIKADKGG